MKNITALRNQRLNEIEEKRMIARLDGTIIISEEIRPSILEILIFKTVIIMI